MLTFFNCKERTVVQPSKNALYRKQKGFRKPQFGVKGIQKKEFLVDFAQKYYSKNKFKSRYKFC